MNIENIEAFVYVVHFNSFHKAADALFLTQPSVSSRIQRLEKELNVSLLTREGKRFSLTEKGKLFLPHAQQTLNSYKKATQLIAETVGEELDTVRLGSTETISHYIVPILMPLLKRSFPRHQFRIVTGNSDSIIDKVLNKELDIGFVRSITHPELESIRFMEDPIRLCVYRGHPFESRAQLSINELEAEPLVFYECGSLNWKKIHRMFETLNQPPRIDYHIDDMETAKKLVLQQQGISFLPMLCIKREVEESLLFPMNIPSLSQISLVTDMIMLKGSTHPLFDAIADTVKELELVN